MVKPSSNVLADRSKAELLVLIFFICVSCVSVILSCLFLAAASWSPARKGLLRNSCVLCFPVFLSLSNM